MEGRSWKTNDWGGKEISESVKITSKSPVANKEKSISHSQKSDLFQSLNSPGDNILFLQRTAGNQAVQRMLKSGKLHAKLKIGQPNDKYEQEADRVAEEVMKMPEPKIQNKSSCSLDDSSCTGREPEENMIQRQEEEEEEPLQTKQTGEPVLNVSPVLRTQIRSLRGGGQPLSQDARNYFEPRFGYDFSQVRLHTDSQSAQVAREINARAFTFGRHMFFEPGAYTPQTDYGKRLLAHELTHVVQQEVSGPIDHIQRQTTLGQHSPGTLPLLKPKPLCENKQDITTLVQRLARLAPGLIDTIPNLSASEKKTKKDIISFVFSDEGAFSMKTFKFVACDAIHIPAILSSLLKKSTIEGYADAVNKEIGLLKKFKGDIEAFLNNKDLAALQRVLAIIAHEQRHITITGAPIIQKSHFEPGITGVAQKVNYYVEEILTRAEEIAVNSRFTGGKYTVPVENGQQEFYKYWNMIKGWLNPAMELKLERYIRTQLRKRYSSGKDRDNAISRGVLSAMKTGHW